MADKTIKGKYQILFLWDAQATTPAYLPIGCLTSNSLNKTIEVESGVITKCESDPEDSYKSRGYEVSFDAVAVLDNLTKASYDRASLIRDKSYENNVQTFWKIVTTIPESTPIITTEFGKGIFSKLDRPAPADGVITFSGTITGKGKVSTTDLVGI